jgi:SpoVK/Ycf46/Vps4 family AAA+-type ATPase
VSSGMKLDPDFTERMDYAVLASMTEGYSAVDLQDLVARAIQHAVMQVAATLGSSEPNMHRMVGEDLLSLD